MGCPCVKSFAIFVLCFQNQRNNYFSKDKHSLSTMSKTKKRSFYFEKKTRTISRWSFLNTNEEDVLKRMCSVYDVQYTNSQIMRVIKVVPMIKTLIENKQIMESPNKVEMRISLKNEILVKI